MILAHFIIRNILLALHATAFTAFFVTVIASPLPRQTTHLFPPSLSIRNSTTISSPHQGMRIARNIPAFSAPPNTVITTQAQSNETFPAQPASHYSQFVDYYKAAKDNSNNIKKCAAQSSFLKDDPRFRKKCVAQLKSFRTNIRGQRAALSAIAAEGRNSGKGLDNYDKTNDIETLIKDTVNLHKNTLKAISVMVNNIPVLGPILGPIVYDLKCFLDDVLNFCEIFLDSTINTLQPLLKTLLGSDPTCPRGAMLLGLCI